MKILVVILFSLTLVNTIGFSQGYPDNEEGQYEDMLTPQYYKTSSGESFREELNEFVHFVRIIPFQHPLKNSNDIGPSYIVKRSFGDGIGRGGTTQHHNAFDMHVGSRDTNVVVYASIAGVVSTFHDAAKYRDYIAITNNVKDSVGNVLGKIVVVYGHVDLELDSLDNLLHNGKNVEKGDTISLHLFSETLGGPHLHFEIRYYRINDAGNEDYYNWQNRIPITDRSEGKWLYGYWNPNVGYGFGHPNNHLDKIVTNVSPEELNTTIDVYPNPMIRNFTIKMDDGIGEIMNIYNLQGQLLESILIDENDFTHDIEKYNKGIYLIRVADKTIKIIKS